MLASFEEKESFVSFAGDTLKKQAESLWNMAEELGASRSRAWGRAGM